MRILKILVIAGIILGGALLFSARYNRAASDDILIDWVVFPMWKGMHGTDRQEEAARFEKIYGRKPNPMEGRQFTFTDWYKAKAAEFCKQNKGVHIRVEMLDYANGKQKLEIRAAAGAMPDIFYWGDVAIGTKFARYGLLEPIEKYITKEDLSDPIYADAVRLATNGDHVWMWPWMICSNFWVANERIFEERKCTNLLPRNPDRTWTYEQFLSAMKATTFDRKTSKGTEHVYGCAFDFTSFADYHLSPFLWGRGARYFDAEGKKLILNSPAGVEGLSFVKSLMDDHKVMPPMGAGLPYTMFLEGRAAVVAADASLPIAMRQAIEEGRMDKDKIKLYGLMPASDGTHPPQSYTSPTGFYVSKQKDPRKRDMIMKFCRFLTSGDNARAVKSRGVFPVRQEAMDVYKNDENIDFYRYMARVSKFAAPDASNEYYYYTWQFTMPMFQSVISGDKSPQDAADDCAKRGTEFLAEERRRLRIDK